MTRGDDISAGERQSGEYKFTLLVGFGVVLGAHVRPEDVDLRVSKGNLLAIRLLHPNVTTQFANLGKRRHRSEHNENSNCKRSVNVSANHLKDSSIVCRLHLRETR